MYLKIIFFKHKDYYTGNDQVHAYTRDNYTESTKTNLY